MAGECRTTKQITHRRGPARAAGLRAHAVGTIIITQTNKQNRIGSINLFWSKKTIWNLSMVLLAAMEDKGRKEVMRLYSNHRDFSVKDFVC